MNRRFLFLQGVASPFFSRLADWITGRGARLSRVNFCAGDALYWNGKPAWHWRGPVGDFGPWVGEKMKAHEVTDVVLFGDQRPLHRQAIVHARRAGVRLHIFEEGYVRPNWVTLERGGCNADSLLPREPQWYRHVNAELPDPGEGILLRSPLFARARHDMAYHAANVLNYIAYPSYRTHRPRLSAIEYAGWAWRYSRYRWWLWHNAGLIGDLIERRQPYYFFPLQLNGDFQMSVHSPFGKVAKSIEHVLRSFAMHAPKQTFLVLKNHPFDTGLVGYRSLIRRFERDFDIRGRVYFLETGHVPTLIAHALGVVTVNSTVGLQALQHLRPTKALGIAIYDLPGLTSQSTLDDFWTRLEPPDERLVHAFRNVVVHATQITGGFYTREGIDHVLAGCDRILEPRSRLETLLERFPVASEAASAGLRLPPAATALAS